MPYGNKFLWKRYKVAIPNPKEKIRGIYNVGEEWDKEKPFKVNPKTNKPYRVLYNGHIDDIALVLIDTLIRGGAEVHVTATQSKGLFVAPGMKELFKKADIPFYQEDQIPQEIRDNTDLLFDCGGSLVDKVTPNIRSIELTHTPREIYKGLQHTVVDVDAAICKLFETFYGTGQAFPDAIKEVLAQDPRWNKQYLMRKGALESIAVCDELEETETIKKIQAYWFHNKKYVVFGFGKVGTGIANALRNAGTLPENIIVIDKDEKACSRAKFEKYTAYNLLSQIEVIKNELKNAFCVVTATGVEGCISQHFERADFPPSLILANMGTPFEYGAKFKREEVLNNGNPFNFMRKTPTDMVFLDAPFELWLRVSDPRLIIEGKGLQPVPEDIDQKVALGWQRRHPMLCPDFWRVIDTSFLFTSNQDDSVLNSDSNSCETSSDSDSDSDSLDKTKLSSSPPHSSHKKSSLNYTGPCMLLGKGATRLHARSKSFESLYDTLKKDNETTSALSCDNQLNDKGSNSVLTYFLKQ